MKKLSSFLAIISIVFLLWLATSAADIAADNARKNPEHSKYNAFILLNDITED